MTIGKIIAIGTTIAFTTIVVNYCSGKMFLVLAGLFIVHSTAAYWEGLNDG